MADDRISMTEEVEVQEIEECEPIETEKQECETVVVDQNLEKQTDIEKAPVQAQEECHAMENDVGELLVAESEVDVNPQQPTVSEEVQECGQMESAGARDDSHGTKLSGSGADSSLGPKNVRVAESAKVRSLALDINSENIVMQKDALGRTQKMFVKDAQGKIVAELKPVNGQSDEKATPPPLRKMTLDQRKVTMLTTHPPIAPKGPQAKKEEVERVRLATKLSVAGVKLAPNATLKQINEVFSKAARAKKKSRKSEELEGQIIRLKNDPVKCHVPNCKSLNYGRPLLYFRTPINMSPEQRKAWMHAMGKPSLATVGSSGLYDLSLYVCELHFQPDCFVEVNGKKLLKVNAVPTLAIAKVTTLVTVSDQIQQVTVPPTKLEVSDLNVPWTSFLSRSKSGPGPSAAAYDVPLLEQQIRVHRHKMEKLQIQLGLPVGQDVEVKVDSEASLKEIRLKSEILASKNRIEELVKELDEKKKRMKDEEKDMNKVESETAGATAAALLKAMQAPTPIPRSTLNRLKEEAACRAKEAMKTRDFYVSKTAAALKGESFRPEDLTVNDQLTEKLAKVEEYEKLRKEATPDSLYLQPSEDVDLPPLILSGNPTEAIKFLAEDKLQAFLRKQAQSYAQKLGNVEDANGKTVKPRVGFVLTTIEDSNNKETDLNEIVELPQDAPASVSVTERKGGGDVPAEAVNDMSGDATSRQKNVCRLVNVAALGSLQPVLQDPQSLINDKRYDKYLNLDVAYTSPLTDNRVNILPDPRSQKLKDLNAANEALNSKLASANYEIGYLTAKVRKMEKLHEQRTKGKPSNEEALAKLRSEVSKLRRWKTNFISKDKIRQRNAKRVLEKRKLRKAYIMKEIAAGRMQKRDLYLIYTRAKLPIDTLPNVGDYEGSDQEGSYVEEDLIDPSLDSLAVSETKKAVQTINPNKKRLQTSSKYPAVPENSQNVFIYKLKPHQKVHLPVDHPQLHSIRNKGVVQVVDPRPNVQHATNNYEEVQVKTESCVNTNVQFGDKTKVKITRRRRGAAEKRKAPPSEDEEELESVEYQTEGDADSSAEQQIIESQEQVEYGQQIITQAGTVTLKYDPTYGGAEFIHLPVATNETIETESVYTHDPMDYIIKTVDDLEQLKCGEGETTQTYYIQTAPTAANVIHMGDQIQIASHQEVTAVVTEQADCQQSDNSDYQQQDQSDYQNHSNIVVQRTSPRKRHKYNKYENY